MPQTNQILACKPLTAEQLDRHIGRITRVPARPQVHDPFPVCPRRELSKEEIESVTMRLYDQSLQTKKEFQASHQPPCYEPMEYTAKELSDNVSEIVYRLYDQAREGHQRELEKLAKRYQLEPTKAPSKLSLITIVEHQYYGQLKARNESRRKLEQKYIVPL